MKQRVAALVRADLRSAIRDGEQLLLTFGIPLVLLVFFSTIDLLPTGNREPVDYLAPGILALALLSIAFVRLAIGLGFDRSFGAIKRFAVTPLRVGEFLAAKVAVTIVLFAVQMMLLAAVGLALGWQPSLNWLLAVAVGLGVLAFIGLGFVVASLAEGLKALAVANALYIALLLLSGLLFELGRLPSWLQPVVKLLPSTAVAELFRETLAGASGPSWAWLTLGAWAVAAPLAALRLFKYT